MSAPPDRIPVTVHEDRVQIGGFGVAFLVDAEWSQGACALVEHTLAPGRIGAPPHRHSREDELSYVLEGTLTVWRDGAITEAGPGTVVRKPRGEWHTFWNAGTVPVRFLELISPPAFAQYFRELPKLIPAHGPPDPVAIRTLAARYGLELDVPRMIALMQQHGVQLG